jgi:hypothetical protein
MEDFSWLLGLTFEDAKRELKSVGLDIRPKSVNNMASMITADFRTDRVNVATVNGIITSVSGLG